MAAVRGREQVRRFMQQLPEQIEKRLLRGAARAAIDVVADEARLRVTSDLVRDAIKTSVKKREGTIVAKANVDGQWPNSVGIWLEYGTEPHAISVDLEASGGRTAGRLNRLNKQGSLVIGGQFVGATVMHPGSRPYPFMRPALDNKESEAMAAAQGYINARVTKGGIAGTDDGGGE